MKRPQRASGRKARRAPGLRGLSLLPIALACAIAADASASDAFFFQDKPIHPGCVHALVMEQGDRISVTEAIRLEGCMASNRARSTPRRDGEWLLFEDEALHGDGVFGYRHIATLENGVYILGIKRVEADGHEVVSLAAVQLAHRPVLRRHEVVDRLVMEMIGEVWIKDIQMASVRTIGNVVSFSAGIGAARVEETVDLSPIGKAKR